MLADEALGYLLPLLGDIESLPVPMYLHGKDTISSLKASQQHQLEAVKLWWDFLFLMLLTSWCTFQAVCHISMATQIQTNPENNDMANIIPLFMLSHLLLLLLN